MKKILSNCFAWFRRAQRAGLMLAIVTAHCAFAEDAESTNTANARGTNRTSFSIDIDTDHRKADSPNYFGLPKEAFDRLSPEQIVELAQIHKDERGNSGGNFSEMIAIVLTPASMFVMICISVWLGVSSRLKRARLQHETLRLMIEKGRPIPPEFLQPEEAPRRPRNDLRTGLILVGVGVGVWLLPLSRLINHAGFIPLLMGVAFLLTWAIEARKNGQSK